ncbi:chitin synthase [Trichonephila clavipes]|nr:chitin synthase [Trichonephila clavipes]
MRGTLTGQRYVDDILRPHVGPFLNGLPGAIFQQYIARPHTTRVAVDFLRHFQTLPWPSRSLDLSPVEHVSSLHLQRKDANLNAVPENEDSEELESSEEEQNDDPGETTCSQQNDNEYWLTDPSLRKSSTKRLSEEENVFWDQLIKTYLYPLIDNPEEKAKVSRQLLELRNKVVFGVLMFNSLFILIVFLLQMQKETLHIDWPLGGKANITYIAMLEEIKIQMTFLELEPINLVLVFFFTLILIIQFIAMLFHRFETLSHILASTNLVDSNDKDTDQINFSHLTDLLQRQGLRDDDLNDEVDDGIPEQGKLNAPMKENGDGFIPNGFVDSGSLAAFRMREKPKFGSLSIAIEKGLQRILDQGKIKYIKFQFN